MSENLELLNRIHRVYADELGRERGTMSQFARDIKVDPRLPSFWKRKDRPVPAIYALSVETVTRGAVTAVDVVANEIRHREKRRDEIRAKRGYR